MAFNLDDLAAAIERAEGHDYGTKKEDQMNITNAAIGAVVATAAVALVAAPASAAVSLPVVYGFDCVTSFCDPDVKPPAQFFGNGGLFVKGLNWTHWGHTYAFGRGTRWFNTCNPTCSAGNYWKSPASITVYDIRHHNGRAYFWRETLRWTTRNGVHHKSRYTYTRHGGTAVFWDTPN